jgi:hypothetical protein
VGLRFVHPSIGHSMVVQSDKSLIDRQAIFVTVLSLFDSYGPLVGQTRTKILENTKA